MKEENLFVIMIQDKERLVNGNKHFVEEKMEEENEYVEKKNLII